MTEPVLDQPRVVASIGHGIAASVAQHVGMDPERQLGALANGFHEAINGVSRKWTAVIIATVIGALDLDAVENPPC